MLRGVNVPVAPEREDAAFTARLHRAPAQIRALAAGRVCGGCQHYRVLACGEVVNVEGNPLKIYRPDAPACGSYA